MRLALYRNDASPRHEHYVPPPDPTRALDTDVVPTTTVDTGDSTPAMIISADRLG